MAKKKKEVAGEVTNEETVESAIETETTETVEETVLEEKIEETVEPEGVAVMYKAPAVVTELKEGDTITIDLDLPKFKNKEFKVIEIGNGTIFVKVNGTKYGFKKERVSKVG